jgi:hypothetical protein
MVYGETLGLQALEDEGGDLGVVFDEKDAHGFFSVWPVGQVYWQRA